MREKKISKPDNHKTESVLNEIDFIGVTTRQKGWKDQMKYIIWGYGVRGKRVIGMLGERQRVAAIVEGNEELHGSTYCGIPIISFDEFLSNYSTKPVIVTPRLFEDEIMEQLKLKNIIGAFLYSREREQIEALLVRLSFNQTSKRYKGNDNLAIYGVSLLGLILYDLFCEYGFAVRLVIPSNTGSSLKRYVKGILKLKTTSIYDVKKNNMRLLLAAKLEETDQNKLHGVAYDKYYDLHLQDELFYKPELERFRDIHKGKRCFIVATGPSLRMDDLDTLYNNREICISVNGIFKAFDQTKWRPNYYVVSDPGVRIWKNEILGLDVQTKFISDIIDCFNDKHYDNIYKWHIIMKANNHEPPDFSDDFARGGYLGMTVIYDGAMQLAAYMGFQEIYLMGTDCTVSPNGKSLHFVPDYIPGDLSIDYIMLAYQAAKRYADLHDIKIYNATRGGALEIFPRVDFDSLFN